MASRTNILRAITRYAFEASPRVKRAFFTHAIRSLVDYAAPCLVVAAPHLMRQLETIQNQSLRLIVSTSLWTKVLNLRAETQIVSIQHRIAQLAATLVAKMAASARLFTTPDRVLAVIDKDP